MRRRIRGKGSRKSWDRDKRVRGKIHFLPAVLKKFDADHGFLLSSGIAYNLLICLIPLILLFLTLAGAYLYGDHEVLNHIRYFLENVFPSLDEKIMESIFRIIEDRRIVGILGIGGLIWTSTWVFGSVRTAFNIVFDAEKARGMIRGLVVDLFMIFLAGIFLLVSMTLTSGMTYLQGARLGFPLNFGPLIQFSLKYFSPFFFTFWMFFFIYKIVPNRKIHSGTALKAALFTSLLWETAKQFFGWYILHLGRFSVIYGSLSTLAIFFFWIYYSSAILLLGGEVASLLELKRRT